MREAHVEAGGFRIRYLETGRGEPLIVLHGGGGLRVSQSHRLLAERRRLILFEMPGFGAWPPGPHPETISELATAIGEAISELGIEAFDLMGSSFGGTVALWLALRAPNRVGSVVLAAPAAIRERHFGQRQIQELLYVHPENRPDGAVPDQAALDRRQALLEGLSGGLRDPELEARMPELRMPVLVVIGTEDRVVPPELGRLYLELLPNSYLVFVYDAAHAVDADRPEAFAALVEDFLDRRVEFLTSARAGRLHP